MKKQIRTIAIALLVVTNIALIGIWAINDYRYTLFYAALLLVTLSTTWIHLVKKDNDQ